jgi:hypothetical protein
VLHANYTSEKGSRGEKLNGIVKYGCGRPPPTRSSRYPHRRALREPRTLAIPSQGPYTRCKPFSAASLPPSQIEVSQHSNRELVRLSIPDITRCWESDVSRFTPKTR